MSHLIKHLATIEMQFVIIHTFNNVEVYVGLYQPCFLMGFWHFALPLNHLVILNYIVVLN
jgi:hypothetical protein